MKEYKRKRKAEEWSLDIRPTKIKKQINSSERWRGKREVEKQLDELMIEPDQDEEDKWNEEIKEYYESTPCAECLMGYALLDKLGSTLYRLGFIILTDYGRDNYSCIHNKKTDTAST